IIFYQAEYGIRDLTVTGVQTCALPISFIQPELVLTVVIAHVEPLHLGGKFDLLNRFVCQTIEISSHESKEAVAFSGIDNTNQLEIGRASCRVRVLVTRVVSCRI